MTYVPGSLTRDDFLRITQPTRLYVVQLADRAQIVPFDYDPVIYNEYAMASWSEPDDGRIVLIYGVVLNNDAEPNGRVFTNYWFAVAYRQRLLAAPRA